MATEINTLSEYFQREGEVCSFQHDEILFRQGDPVRWMFWISSGHARLVRRSLSGHEITLQSLHDGLLAEASLYQDSYHCDGIAERAGTGLRVDRRVFEKDLLESPKLHAAFSRYLADNLREARALSEIKSLKRISERVDAWIALKGKDGLKRGQLTGIADQIAVTREALYRELSRRSVA